MLLWASPAPLPSRHRGFFFGRLQPELLPATMGCPQTTRSHRTLGPRMYKKIMVPVDLSHRERLEKAVATAADLSKCYKVPAELVVVTATAPGARSEEHTYEHQSLMRTSYAVLC